MAMRKRFQRKSTNVDLIFSMREILDLIILSNRRSEQTAAFAAFSF